MRKLLLLALLLYDVVALALAGRTSNFEYEDTDANKRHSYDERRNWRKKVLMKPQEDHKEWEERRRHDYDALAPPVPRYDDGDRDRRERETFEHISYRRRSDDADKMAPPLPPPPPPQGPKSGEVHPSYNMDKDVERKIAMNCDRPHERYEACFAGCASVTCDNPRDRMRPCYPFCEQGCICIPPYVRDDRTHKCVLPEECSRGLKGIPDLGDDV